MATNRQAEQTPVLWGDPSLNFSLRVSTASRAPTPLPDPKETELLLTQLKEAWTRRDALEKQKPYRHTPL